MARPTFVGEPTSAVLYRTPRLWRYAIVDHRGGILDGGLPGLPPDATPDEAKAQFLANLSEAEATEWAADWTASEEPPDPTSTSRDWWNADLRRVRPEA
jgi:hypothetical protein